MSLPNYVHDPLVYLEDCCGAPYYEWHESDGKFGGGPPAWAVNAPHPPNRKVRDEGLFCAGALNLASRVNGLYIFQDTDYWAGGIPWWGERLKRQGVLKTSNRLDFAPGTLFIRLYTGPALPDQGHGAVMGRHGNLLQADSFGGMNENRTLYQTNQTLTTYDGGGFEFYVDPQDWLQ